MKRIAGIGDNTVDIYLHARLMYPGGNAVNVAVLSQRLGNRCSYIGRLGNDAAGELLLNSLKAEGIDLSHCRVVDGPNAWSTIDLVEGERVFGPNNKGVSIGWEPSRDDLEFLSTHHAVHSSIYSRLEASLEPIRKAARVFSFDFSSDWTLEYLEQVVPYLDVAFLSAPHQSTEECYGLLERITGLGADLAVVTRGRAGSLAFDGEKVHAQGIVETQVVDTLGAGDAFIAAFLSSYLEGAEPPAALEAGAVYAARNCATRGAFGYGVPYEGVLSLLQRKDRS